MDYVLPSDMKDCSNHSHFLPPPRTEDGVLSNSNGQPRAQVQPKKLRWDLHNPIGHAHINIPDLRLVTWDM